MARLSTSFTIDVPPARAQAMFERDILPSLQKGSAFRLAAEHPGVLVFSDGAADFNRVFDPQRVVEGENPSRRRSMKGPAPPPEPPRPRVMGMVAPNVEHRQPWLYAALRRISSRTITVRFEQIGEDAGSGTRVVIDGKADKRLTNALGALGAPGQWPETALRSASSTSN